MKKVMFQNWRIKLNENQKLKTKENWIKDLRKSLKQKNDEKKLSEEKVLKRKKNWLPMEKWARMRKNEKINKK